MNEDQDFVESVNKWRNEPDKYKIAYNEWQDKTEWVQQTAKAKEFGMHRADVLRLRIEALEKENEELKGQVAKNNCTIGVGDGSGKLFVHGDYESIKVVQQMIFDLEELRSAG